MARMTKKDIYKKYGIEFDGNKLFCDPLGIWVKPLMPIGTNTKVGKAATWSMIHGNETFTLDTVHEKVRHIMELANIDSLKGSCPMHCKGCYCDNGCFNFPDNKALNTLKLILARYYMEWLERALKAQIEADKLHQVRIHVAGDYFALEYVEMWVHIANTFPGVIFWTYTKVPYALELLDKVANICVVPSLTPFGYNFGTCGQLKTWHAKLSAMGYRVHICACGTPFEQHCADCKHGCKAMKTECDFVLFIKHSTNDYKAGIDDPNDYAAVLDIIKSQRN